MDGKQALLDSLVKPDVLTFDFGYKIAKHLETIRSSETAAKDGEYPLFAEALESLKSAGPEYNIKLNRWLILGYPALFAEALCENNIRLLRLLAPECLNE